MNRSCTVVLLVALTACSSSGERTERSSAGAEALQGQTAIASGASILLQSTNGDYVSAHGDGGSDLGVDETSASGWARFTINDLTHDELTDGDAVTLLAGDGTHYVSAWCGGGGSGQVAGYNCAQAYAIMTQASTWETFALVKIGGSSGAQVAAGDKIAFRSLNGYYASAWASSSGASGGGGPGSVWRFPVTWHESWETFTIDDAAPEPPPSPGPGIFAISGGQILDPAGKPFLARGIGLHSFATGDLDFVLSTLPSLNFIRLAACSGQGPDDRCYNNTPDTPSSLASFVQAATSKGIVVEIEDHEGWVDPNIPTGSQLSAELAWYAAMATAFAGNDHVWFGTMNEPLDSASPVTIAQQELAIYNAVRTAGNNSMVMLEFAGGSNPTFAQQNASSFSGMHDVLWDMHFYPGTTGGYSTDQSTVDDNFTKLIADAQSVKSADGIIPLIVGEYGPSGAGSSYDQGHNNSIYAVQQYGAAYGAVAWVYWDGGVDQITSSREGTLTPWGLELQTYLKDGQSTTF